LPVEAHIEMVQQIIQFHLTAKQAKDICEKGVRDEGDDVDNQPSTQSLRLIKVMRDVDGEDPHHLATALLREEKNVHLARARLQNLMAFLQETDRYLGSE